MKKTLLATTLATITLFSVFSAYSADSVDLKVGGTLLPKACTPTLSSGGIIDYGTIKTNTLKSDAYSILDIKSLDFSIVCDNKAKVALKAINGRRNSLAGALEGSGGGGTPPVNLFGKPLSTNGAVGLGMDGTKKIGGYIARFKHGSFTADGTAVDIIASSNYGKTWFKAIYGDVYYGHVVLQQSWAVKGTEFPPIEFKTLGGKLEVQAYINKTSGMDISKPIKLDGQTTLELIYL